tara:strand:- start:4443 stop:4958 length:516 start_codon:yes stop_codon:yes gene_type:complete
MSYEYMSFEFIQKNIIEVMFHYPSIPQYIGKTIICYLPTTIEGIQTLEYYINAFRNKSLFKVENKTLISKYKLETSKPLNSNFMYIFDKLKSNNFEYKEFNYDKNMRWFASNPKTKILFTVLKNGFLLDNYNISFNEDIFWKTFSNIIFCYEKGWLNDIQNKSGLLETINM